MCCGTGWDVKADNILVCDTCGGRGYVVMEICGGCGLPAWDQVGQVVPYCGDEDCLKKMLNVVKPGEEHKARILPFAAGAMNQIAQVMAGRFGARREGRRLTKLQEEEYEAAINRWQLGTDCDAGYGHGFCDT